MDNFESVKCVLQMAKAYQDYLTDSGFPTDQMDDEAIVIVERMLGEVEGVNTE